MLKRALIGLLLLGLIGAGLVLSGIADPILADLLGQAGFEAPAGPASPEAPSGATDASALASASALQPPSQPAPTRRREAPPLEPGSRDPVSRAGLTIRCAAWEGDWCLEPQIRPGPLHADCGPEFQPDPWHFLYNQGGAAEKWCYIATGDPGVSRTGVQKGRSDLPGLYFHGNHGAPFSGRSCGRALEQPVAGTGEPLWSFLQDPERRFAARQALTVLCAVWAPPPPTPEPPILIPTAGTPAPPPSSPSPGPSP